eukprot:gb/GECG01014627.1/.p1 GENE.gb/GECG01014627.1/~~gb/GECG01014627.1/.p1  ORF type:complete len:501 (+),score=48.26 gb/GECG01014627.1/:1-1503(+)
MTDSLLNEVAPKAALEATASQPEHDPRHDALMMDDSGQTRVSAINSSCANGTSNDTQEQHLKAIPELEDDSTTKNRRTQNETTSSPNSDVPLNPSELCATSPHFHDPDKKAKSRVAEETEHYARSLWRNTSVECYLRGHQTCTFSPRLRAILIDWLSELCQALHFHRRTISVAVNLVDTFLVKRGSVSKGELQLWGATALYVAGKQEEAYAPSMDEFLEYVAHAIKKSQLLECEQTLILLANWNTNPSTSYDWLTFMLHQLGAIASNIRTRNYYTCETNDEPCARCEGQAAKMLHDWSSEMLFNVSPEIARTASDESPCNIEFGTIFVPFEAVAIPRKHVSCELFLKSTHVLDLVRMDSGFLKYSSPVIAYSVLLTLLPRCIVRLLDQIIISVVEPFFPDLGSHATEAKNWIQRVVGSSCPKYSEHPQLKQLASRHIVHHRDLQQLQPHNAELLSYVTKERDEGIAQSDDVNINVLPAMATVSTISKYIKTNDSPTTSKN